MPSLLDVNIQSASANGAASALTATLAAIAGNRLYITGLSILCGGATSGSNIDCTLTNVIGGTRHYEVQVPVGVNVDGVNIRETFNPPLRNTAVNQNSVLTMPSAGVGNLSQSIQLEGFYVPEP